MCYTNSSSINILPYSLCNDKYTLNEKYNLMYILLSSKQAQNYVLVKMKVHVVNVTNISCLCVQRMVRVIAM